MSGSVMSRLLGVALIIVALCGVAPSVEAASRHRMSFTPGDRSRSATRMRPARAQHRHASRPRHGARHRGRAHARDDDGGAAAAPGGGFKVENGILTYPAPARFQPRNLRPR